MKEILEDFGLAIVEEAFGIIMCCVLFYLLVGR